MLADGVDDWVAARLVPAVVELAITTEDQRQVRSVILMLLAGRVDDRMAEAMVRGTVELAMEEGERQVREALLELITDQIAARKAVTLAGGVIQLHPTVEEMSRCREILLGMLTTETDAWVTTALAGSIALFDPTRTINARPAATCCPILLARRAAGWPRSWCQVLPNSTPQSATSAPGLRG